MYFNDTHTARPFLECETLQETKQLVRTVTNCETRNKGKI